jgi:hypothetical protein
MRAQRQVTWTIWLCVLVLFGAACEASAQDAHFWQPAWGAWVGGDNWVPVGPPGSLDLAYVINGGTAEIYLPTPYTATAQTLLVYDASGTSRVIQTGADASFGELYVGLGPGSGGNYELTANYQLDVAGNLWIANTGTGHFTQTAGQVQVINDLHLGMLLGGQGTYTLSDGNLAASRVFVGDEGVGAIVQEHGYCLIQECMYLGINATGDGTYRLEDGSLDVATRTVVGLNGKGFFTQTGGTCSIAEWLMLGTATGGQGTYTLADGVLQAEQEYIGAVGTGFFDHTGGTNTTSWLSIGGGSVQSTYRLSGAGQLTATDGITVASASRLEWIGGTLDTPSVALNPGATLALGYWCDLPATLLDSGMFTGLPGADLRIVNGAEVTHTRDYIRVASLEVGETASHGRYVLGGRGQLSTPVLSVGGCPTGDSFFDWIDATASLTAPTINLLPRGTMNVFNDCDYPGRMHIQGGTLDVKSSVFTFTNEGEVCTTTGSILGDTVRLSWGQFTQAGGHTRVATFLNGWEEGEGGGGGGAGGGACLVTGGTLEAGLLSTRAYFEQTGGSVVAGTFINERYGEVVLEGGTLDADTYINRGYGGVPQALALGGAEHTTWLKGNSIVSVDNFINEDEVHLTARATVRGRTSLEGTFDNRGGFFMDYIERKDGRREGGTFEDRLINHGYFRYQCGAFNGALEQRPEGYFDYEGNFTAGRGIYNYGTIGVNPFTTVRGNGPDGVVNYGQVYLDNGTLAGSKVVNDYGAYLYGRGTIDADFENNGTLEPEATLTITGNTTNRGAIYIDNLERVEVKQPMSNSGYIEFRRGWGEFPQTGGVLAGPGLVTNEYGGYILMDGGGSITAPIVNNGEIEARNSMNLVITSLTDNAGMISVGDDTRLSLLTSFTNSGLIVLEEDANLSGGAITNSGSLGGNGTVANTIINEGVIAVAPLAQEHGAPYGLMLSGTGCTNAAGGRIEVPQDCILSFTRGLAANAGTIALDGGTFDNNARPMTNTGILSGHGTFRMGTLTNAATGAIRVADHPTLFYGPLVNAGQVQVFSCTTSFFDHVTNNSTGAIKNTAGIIRFLGGFTNSGSYTSDPADNYFTDLTNTATGYLAGGLGDRFIVTGNFVNDSARTDAWDTSAAQLRFTGAASHTMAVSGPSGTFGWGILTVDAGNALTVAGASATAANTVIGGTLNQVSGVTALGRMTGPGNFSVAGGATLGATYFQGVSIADIQGLATVGADGSTSTTRHLNVNYGGGGTLDLALGSLVVDYEAGPSSPLAEIQALVLSGRNGGTWDGPGITSSWVRDYPDSLGIGVTENSAMEAEYGWRYGSGPGGDGYPLFGNVTPVPVDDTAILVKTTYLGDLDLNGQVDLDDLILLAGYWDPDHYYTHMWWQGDMNYDGWCDLDDLILLAGNWQLGVGSPLVGGSPGAVPEPATLGLMALGLLAMLRQRRGRPAA